MDSLYNNQNGSIYTVLTLNIFNMDEMGTFKYLNFKTYSMNTNNWNYNSNYQITFNYNKQMQAIILAAGMGKRLGDLTESNTKCIIKVNGVTLFERILKQHTKTSITLLLANTYQRLSLGIHQANQFKALPSSNLNAIIGRVSYLVLTSIQDDIPWLKKITGN